MKNEIMHIQLENPPEFLFVATNEEESYSAFKNGLNRKKTPFIEVFESEEEARKKLRSKIPYFFTVLSGLMAEDGYRFYRAETGAWLTDEVPAKYLRLC